MAGLEAFVYCLDQRFFIQRQIRFFEISEMEKDFRDDPNLKHLIVEFGGKDSFLHGIE